MRGSIYYQTSQLVKMIFKDGASKIDRVNPNSEYYMCIASFNTMNSYRQIWNNFGIYIKKVYEVKNMEKVTSKYIEDYLNSKLADGISKQYYEKICSALAKLGLALNRFSIEKSSNCTEYKFFQNKGIAQAKYYIKNGIYEQGRAYREPKIIIEKLDNNIYKIAASIQYEGGARFKGVRKITMKQLKRMKIDEITGSNVGIIETKEKGGRVGDVFVSSNTYEALKKVLIEDKKFEINYEKYAKAIRESCQINNVECYGSHGFRWCFAKRRLIEYQDANYSYDESLKKVSSEMKHNRKEITEHYIG